MSFHCYLSDIRPLSLNSDSLTVLDNLVHVCIINSAVLEYTAFISTLKKSNYMRPRCVFISDV